MGKIKVKLCKYRPTIQPKAVIEKHLFVSSVLTGRKQRIKRFTFSFPACVVCNSLK